MPRSRPPLTVTGEDNAIVSIDGASPTCCFSTVTEHSGSLLAENDTRSSPPLSVDGLVLDLTSGVAHRPPERGAMARTSRQAGNHGVGKSSFPPPPLCLRNGELYRVPCGMDERLLGPSYTSATIMFLSRLSRLSRLPLALISSSSIPLVGTGKAEGNLNAEYPSSKVVVIERGVRPAEPPPSTLLTLPPPPPPRLVAA
ncbi:hypothetical protein LZ30DRAFT_323018 [Colletotrichum cereale]|nr:hypothetical protein LZ30DRAFT_323018 [Colletotrichum cereale]